MTLIEIPAPPKVGTEIGPAGASTRGSHRLAAAGGGCEMQFALHYLMGVSPRVEPPWRMTGKLVHLALANYYGAKLDAPPDYVNIPLRDQLEAMAPDQPTEVETALQVLDAYKRWSAGESWRPVYVEEEFRATLGELDPGGPNPELDNEVITCRSDLVVEQNGELLIVDYKCSAGEWGHERLPRWSDNNEYRIFWQGMINLHILRKRLNKPVRGFVILRVKRKAPFDFDRNLLQIPQLAYERVPRIAREFVRRELDLVRRVKAGERPVQNFTACHSKYGACDYISLCSASSSAFQQQVLDLDFVER